MYVNFSFFFFFLTVRLLIKIKQAFSDVTHDCKLFDARSINLNKHLLSCQNLRIKVDCIYYYSLKPRFYTFHEIINPTEIKKLSSDGKLKEKFLTKPRVPREKMHNRNKIQHKACTVKSLIVSPSCPSSLVCRTISLPPRERLYIFKLKEHRAYRQTLRKSHSPNTRTRTRFFFAERAQKAAAMLLQSFAHKHTHIYTYTFVWV